MGTGHYFEPDPEVASDPRTLELSLADLHLRLTTDRGVFSAGRIDPGTFLLLAETAPGGCAAHLRPQPGQRALDLGCGYGPIALSLAARCRQASITAVDINRRALQLTVANAAANGLDNVTALEPASLDGHPEFDLIWSNPPIRIGKQALQELLVTWLGRLQRPSGAALMVVQRHLGADSLAEWLEQQGYTVARLASRQGYRLLEVRPR